MVVTIVVLLILAGVSISLVLDNNGIIQKSKDARREYGQAKDNEQAQLDGVATWIDNQTGENGGTSKPIKVGVNEKATSNGTINGEVGNSNNPTIPEGYTPINTDTSSWDNGSSNPTQDSVDRGLVIKDDNDNEWVWVPVDSTTLATMYETSSDAKTLCKTTVTTNKYSKSDIISGLTRTTPGTTSDFREPDLVVGNNGTSYDAKEAFYKTILGFSSKEKMAEAFVADYNEMIASIEKYGGFYIGRYELSGTVTEPTEKPGKTLTKTDWYNLYNACRSSKLQASDKVKTQMIWGCQWDVTCNFIANKGDKKSITDSRSWGNYTDSMEPANTGNYVEESAKNTGSNEAWKANNIYDLAGNYEEWTQEAKSTYQRACRGSCCRESGTNKPVSYRAINQTIEASYYLRYSSNFNNKVT